MTDSDVPSNNPKIPAHIQAIMAQVKQGQKVHNNKPTPKATETSIPKSSQLLDVEVKGQDLRTLAEARANHAGEKWREQAISRGEIQREIGGPQGLEPTRYGDWEKAGRCFDF